MFYKGYKTSDVSGHYGRPPCLFDLVAHPRARALKKRKKVTVLVLIACPVFLIATYESIFHSDRGRSFRRHL